VHSEKTYQNSFGSSFEYPVEQQGEKLRETSLKISPA